MYVCTKVVAGSKIVTASMREWQKAVVGGFEAEKVGLRPPPPPPPPGLGGETSHPGQLYCLSAGRTLIDEQFGNLQFLVYLISRGVQDSLFCFTFRKVMSLADVPGN